MLLYAIANLSTHSDYSILIPTVFGLYIDTAAQHPIQNKIAFIIVLIFMLRSNRYNNQPHIHFLKCPKTIGMSIMMIANLSTLHVILMAIAIFNTLRLF